MQNMPMIGPMELLLLLFLLVCPAVVIVAVVAAVAGTRRKRPPAPQNLTPCPDCGGTVSISAAACPHCGRPMLPGKDSEPPA